MGEVTEDLFLMQCHCVMIRLDTRVKKEQITLNSVVFVPISSPRSINTDANLTVNYSLISIPAYYCCTDEGV